MSKKTTEITALSDYRGSDPDTGDEFYLPEGETREVSVEKAEQLRRDFPDQFKFAGKQIAKPSDATVKAADEAGIDINTLTGTGKDGTVTTDDVKEAVAYRDAVSAASEAGIEVAAIGNGSGANGILTAADIHAYIAEHGQAPAGVSGTGGTAPKGVTPGAGDPPPPAAPNATDAARKKAQELNVDLTTLKGTGSTGNITVDDVEAAAAQ